MKMVFNTKEISAILSRHVEKTFRLPKGSVTGEVTLRYSSSYSLDTMEVDLPTEDGIPIGIDGCND